MLLPMMSPTPKPRFFCESKIPGSEYLFRGKAARSSLGGCSKPKTRPLLFFAESKSNLSNVSRKSPVQRPRKAFPFQSLLPLTILMPFRIPIGTSSSLGTPTIEISSSSAFFFFNFFINQIKRPTSASAATPPTTAPAIIVLFRPASAASEGAGLAKVLLGGGKGEVVKVEKEYVGETGIDEMGPSVVEESEESVMVAVKVESVG